jgi:hypothetical protein
MQLFLALPLSVPEAVLYLHCNQRFVVDGTISELIVVPSNRRQWRIERACLRCIPTAH